MHRFQWIVTVIKTTIKKHCKTIAFKQWYIFNINFENIYFYFNEYNQ